MAEQRASRLQDRLEELSSSKEKQKELSEKLDAASSQAQEAVEALSELRRVDDDLMARPITR